MKLRRTLRHTCPRTGGTWLQLVAGPEHGRDYCLADYTRPRKLSKGQRAAARRRRRAHQGEPDLLPAPTPRLAVDDPERRRLQAEVLAVGRCQHCGRLYRLTLDHIVPLVVGGGNHRANLQCLCRRCNRAKGRAIWAAAA